MSGPHYSYRPYQSGDEDAINALYLKVTGRSRSRDQWHWQWQEAPGGPGDIWLIEATHSDGRVELIGHHGVMPIRFTWGERDLLFGKTENTMVLPGYRDKILYPRFERRFAQQYQQRYHALFSTMGPEPAIRQRKAMGYSARNSWVYMENSKPIIGDLVFVLMRSSMGFGKVALKLLTKPRTGAHLPLGVELLTSEEARKEAFLEQYWAASRLNWGISPRRDSADLSWRYWDNPYAPHYALIFRSPDYGEALVVAEEIRHGVVEISDISMQSPSSDALKWVVDTTLNALSKKLSARLVTCVISHDCFPEEWTAEMVEMFHPSWPSRWRKMRENIGKQHMPRKITEIGGENGIPEEPWNITMFVSEGRR